MIPIPRTAPLPNSLSRLQPGLRFGQCHTRGPGSSVELGLGCGAALIGSEFVKFSFDTTQLATCHRTHATQCEQCGVFRLATRCIGAVSPLLILHPSSSLVETSRHSISAAASHCDWIAHSHTWLPLFAQDTGVCYDVSPSPSWTGRAGCLLLQHLACCVL